MGSDPAVVLYGKFVRFAGTRDRALPWQGAFLPALPQSSGRGIVDS